MTNELIDAIRRAIPPRNKRSGRGFIDFNCPACGDRKMRGGLLETPTGGFRYRCFNGGCEYEDSTGWEPGSPFAGRARRFFLDLGGDLTDLSPEILRAEKRIKLSNQEFIDYYMDPKTAVLISLEPQVVVDFPEMELPAGTQLLWDAHGLSAEKAQAYVLDRGDFFRHAYPFCWSPKYPHYVIIPLLHRDKIIGWIGRRVVKEPRGTTHLKCPNWPSDYMLNQNRLHEHSTVLVVQGAFDAIAIDGLCTFGNTLTQKQINLLNQSGKRIVMVPDYKGTEWKAYWQVAKQNGWDLAIPDWGGNYGRVDHIKDPGDAIKRMGLLCTMQKLMDPMTITNDYNYAELIYIERSTSGLNDRKDMVRQGTPTERFKRN